MNLLIDRQALALALRHAAQVAGAVAPLDHVTLDVSTTGLVLSVSDGRTGIRTTLDADITAPGKCATAIVGLRKALQATMAYSLVRLETAQNGLRVRAGSVEIYLPRGKPAMEHVFSDLHLLASLPTDPRPALRRVCATIEETDGRHHLDFVLLESGGFVATDSIGLVQEDLPELTLEKPIGIPRAAALALASVPDRLATASLTIGSADGVTIAALGHVRVAFDIADAQRFPAWRDILPGVAGAATVAVDRAALLAAVRKCTLFNANVALTTEGSEMLTVHATMQGRDIREEVSSSGTFRRCHVNGRLFLEMLAVTVGKTVILLSRGVGSPVTWHTGYGRAALMPVREDA